MKVSMMMIMATPVTMISTITLTPAMITANVVSTMMPTIANGLAGGNDRMELKSNDSGSNDGRRR